jgi:hypothetical protein
LFGGIAAFQTGQPGVGVGVGEGEGVGDHLQESEIRDRVSIRRLISDP